MENCGLLVRRPPEYLVLENRGRLLKSIRADVVTLQIKPDKYNEVRVRVLTRIALPTLSRKPIKSRGKGVEVEFETVADDI
jgi:hypothetical protein